MIKKQKSKKTRKRGGASVPCPSCGRDSEVVITRRTADDEVRRIRMCRHGHKFQTLETTLEIPLEEAA